MVFLRLKREQLTKHDLVLKVNNTEIEKQQHVHLKPISSKHSVIFIPHPGHFGVGRNVSNGWSRPIRNLRADACTLRISGALGVVSGPQRPRRGEPLPVDKGVRIFQPTDVWVSRFKKRYNLFQMKLYAFNYIYS